MAPMRARSVAAPTSRPWLPFLVGAAIGVAIFLLTQVLTETRIAFGPYALNGNGALAVPFIGFPLAIYAGWTWLGDDFEGPDLALRLATFSAGLVLGGLLLGLFFGLPVALVTGAIYATWMRGSAARRRDLYLWVAFAASVVVSALPWLGLFGVALLPASIILLARDKPASTRILLGVLLAVATVAIVFGVPALFPAPAPTA